MHLYRRSFLRLCEWLAWMALCGAFQTAHATTCRPDRPLGNVSMQCGDGRFAPWDNEQCDDGNLEPGDGCDVHCQIEPCWSCAGADNHKTVCTPQTGTSCPDDGNACTQDVCDAGSCTHPIGNAGAVCRSALGPCDADDHCDGLSAACPDSHVPDNTSCANPCSSTATCQNGECQGTNSCVAALCGTSGPCVISGKVGVQNGAILDLSGRPLTIARKAQLDAGSGSFSIVRASNITVEKSSVLHTQTVAGHAGTILLRSPGTCTFGGKVQANGIASRDLQLGGDGGSVVVSCGDIVLDPSAVIEAKGDGIILNSEGDFAVGKGGRVTLRAGGGFSAAKGAKLDVSGKGDDGGIIDVSATGNCDFSSSASAQSNGFSVGDFGSTGLGGTVQLACADVALRKGSKLTVGTSKEDRGGKVELDATGGNIVIEKRSTMTNRGFGGQIGLTATGSCSLAGVVVAESQIVSPNEYGTAVQIACNSLTLEKQFKFKGRAVQDPIFGIGLSSAAGSLTATIPGACSIAGSIDLRARGIVEYDADDGSVDLSQPAQGGMVRIVCDAAVTHATGAKIDTSTNWGPGGQVIMQSRYGAVTAGGTIAAGHPGRVQIVGLDVTAAKTSSLSGGFIDIAAQDVDCNIVGDVEMDKKIIPARGYVATAQVEGCDVTLSDTGLIAVSDGNALLTAHHNLVVDGHMSASDRGYHYLVYRDAVSIANPNRIHPSTTPYQNTALTPCP